MIILFLISRLAFGCCDSRCVPPHLALCLDSGYWTHVRLVQPMLLPAGPYSWGVVLSFLFLNETVFNHSSFCDLVLVCIMTTYPYEQGRMKEKVGSHHVSNSDRTDILPFNHH